MSTPARADTAPGWRIGSLGGTPVYLGRSWPLLVLLMFGLWLFGRLEDNFGQEI